MGIYVVPEDERGPGEGYAIAATRAEHEGQGAAQGWLALQPAAKSHMPR
jgi:hypothetical protein